MNMENIKDISSLTSIPIVDFSKGSLGKEITEEDMYELGKSIYDAFSTIGFVYLKNTGISEDNVKKIHGIAKEFFSLNENIKRKFAVHRNNIHGYIGIKGESLNLRRPGDYKEAFDIRGPNIPLDSDIIWPDDYVNTFSKDVREFAGLCKDLTHRILKYLAYGMKLKDKEILTRGHSRMNMPGNFTDLRLLCYPPLPPNTEILPGQIRLGEHSDLGSISLIFQDEVGGLEVSKSDGTFIFATPIPDTVLVNVADCLQFWSKGELKSTVHRIVNPENPALRNRPRYSVGYFPHPNFEIELAELEHEDGVKSSQSNVVKSEKAEKVITAFDHASRTIQNILNTD